MMTYLENIFSLKDKTAAVIGGGGVLAGAMAEGLARAGADVAILDINFENAKKQAEAVSDLGVRSMALQADASCKADLENACRKIVNAWGKADILINAPGINSAVPFMEISEEEWDRILAVNLKSIFLACQVFGGIMLNQKSGSIINISSASSEIPLSRVFTYSVSKAGVDSLTRNLAREWGTRGVRVNAVAPGFFPAEQNRKILTADRVESIMRHTPMERFGESEELAGAVIWLASGKASSFVTGAVIRVDGGYTAMTI